MQSSVSNMASCGFHFLPAVMVSHVLWTFPSFAVRSVATALTLGDSTTDDSGRDSLEEVEYMFTALKLGGTPNRLLRCLLHIRSLAFTVVSGK